MLLGKPPSQILGECVLIATYLINCNLLVILVKHTPYEKLFQTKPSYSHLKFFVIFVMLPLMLLYAQNLIHVQNNVNFLYIHIDKKDTKYMI